MQGMTVSVHPAGWWGEEGECHTVPKKSLYFRLETNPVTDGADATVDVWHKNKKHTLASTPSLTGSGFFMQRHSTAHVWDSVDCCRSDNMTGLANNFWRPHSTVAR